MVTGPAVLTLKHAQSSHDRAAFRAVAQALVAKLPFAEIEHVGSTAVPGCLTKGDLDVLVRVLATDFERATRVLDELLVASERNLRTAEYAEYDFARDRISASVQVAVAGSDLDDHFHRLKAILRSDREALAAYNAVKTGCEGGSMTAYRRAKERMIDSLLATHPLAAAPGDVALRPGIHE